MSYHRNNDYIWIPKNIDFHECTSWNYTRTEFEPVYSILHGIRFYTEGIGRELHHCGSSRSSRRVFHTRQTVCVGFTYLLEISTKVPLPDYAIYSTLCVNLVDADPTEQNRTERLLFIIRKTSGSRVDSTAIFARHE